MENPVSSSWGSTNSRSEAENLTRVNLMRDGFQKDYDTLHKFIDMMKNAESMSVERYNDVVVEKHNESIGFLKTAIFQAQSNVLDEIARQREAATKTTFTYLKPRGPQQQLRGLDSETTVDDDESRSVSDYASSGEVEKCAAPGKTTAVDAEEVARAVKSVEYGNRFGVSVERPRPWPTQPEQAANATRKSINVAARKMPISGIQLVGEDTSDLPVENEGGPKLNAVPEQTRDPRTRDPRSYMETPKCVREAIKSNPGDLREAGSSSKIIQVSMNDATKAEDKERADRKSIPPNQIITSLRKVASRSMKIHEQWSFGKIYLSSWSTYTSF